MSNDANLTGEWVGEYYQHGDPHPIEASLVQDGERLTGAMRDGETDSESTVFKVAADAGLPPGADERIEADLRAMFPDARAEPIRFITHLPPESSLEGSVKGDRVQLLKRYQGAHYGGYRVGDKLVGHRIEDHSVQYGGRLSPDGLEIEGRWWIDPIAGAGGHRTEGSFTLRRRPAD